MPASVARSERSLSTWLAPLRPPPGAFVEWPFPLLAQPLGQRVTGVRPRQGFGRDIRAPLRLLVWRGDVPYLLRLGVPELTDRILGSTARVSEIRHVGLLCALREPVSPRSIYSNIQTTDAMIAPPIKIVKPTSHQAAPIPEVRWRAEIGDARTSWAAAKRT
jgi:hypothetical protein